MAKVKAVFQVQGARGPILAKLLGSACERFEHPAKPVQPDRLQFWKEPSFDPLPFLGQLNQESYLWPLDLVKAPEEVAKPLIRFVCVALCLNG